MQLLAASVSRTSVYSHAVALVALSLLGATACGDSGADWRKVRADALIVLPGASHVAYSNENEGTVAYQMAEQYPAQSAIETIRARLNPVS